MSIINKINPLIILSLLLTYITPSSVKAASPGHNNVPADAPAPVFSPDVPNHITFCGKKIDLDRVDMYERLDRELTVTMYSHSSTLLMLKRANKYFPVMAPIIKKAGIPADAIYLACAESTLNPRAASAAKAAGIWQLIPSTARQYGLEVSDEVDERYDIEKATKAACRYMTKAYEKYGDWATAMASYNAGMGRISSELDKQSSDCSFDLYLNEETSRYVFRIMAIKTILEHPSAYGYKLKARQLYQPEDCRTVEVSGAVDDWAAWAAGHGISYAQLKEANPWIRSRKLTNKGGKTYGVKIPQENQLYRSRQKTSVCDQRHIN